MQRRKDSSKPDKYPILDLDTKIGLDILKERIPHELQAIRKGTRIIRRYSKEKDFIINLFSLFLINYIKSKAKEFHYSPRSNSSYSMTFLMKDGSKGELIPPPLYMFSELLKSFREQKLMDYDPYSDERQCNLIDIRYKGKIRQLELCVQQSKYGREIVLKKPDKKIK